MQDEYYRIHSWLVVEYEEETIGGHPLHLLLLACPYQTLTAPIGLRIVSLPGGTVNFILELIH